MSNQAPGLIDLLSVWHFEEDVLVYSDGSLGVGFQLKPKDISCATNQTINELSQKLDNLLKTVREGLRLQFFYKTKWNVSATVNAHEKLSEGIDPLYAPVREARLQSLQERLEDRRYFSTDIYFFVRSESHRFPKRRFFEREKKYTQISRDDYVKFKNGFLRDVKQIESSLVSCDLLAKRVDEKSWFDLLYEYFNLSRSEKFDAPSIKTFDPIFGIPLTQQLILSEVSVHKSHIVIGDYLFRAVTLNSLPEDTFAALCNDFLKLPFHFWLSQNVTILDQKKEYGNLQLKRRLAHSMVSGAKNVSDMESETKLSDIEGLVTELLQGSEKVVSSDFTIIVWAKTVDELNEKSDEVLRAFRGMNQAEGVVETFPTLDIFMAAMPGSCAGLRSRKLKTSNLSHLMPVYGSWAGNKRPVCLLSNRDSSLVAIDPFEPGLPNWNGLVIGSSGSGKSFTLSQLVLMFYGQTPSPKIVWLDNGASSKNVVECLDGQFVELTLQSGICLNPFDLDKGEKEPSPSKVKLILGVIENICKEDGTRGIPKVEKAFLEEAIFDVYRKTRGGTPTLSAFREILANHPNEDIRRYGQILYSWTGNTAFGRMLDGKTNISLDKNLVSFEMKGLDVYPELENVFLLLLTEFIQREASSNVEQKYLLIIDEAWKMLQSNSGAQFTIEAYRTFRKFNAGIWAISQNINDFKLREEIANAILQNTPSRIILKQRGVNWEDFQKVLALEDVDVENIKSLHQEKGKYSEFYLIQDENKTVIRLEPDLLSYWICTTDPLDKLKISEVKDSNPEFSHMQVLQKLARITPEIKTRTL